MIETLTEHISLLKWVHANGIHLKDYLKARARVLMQKDKKSAEGAKATKDKTAADGSSHAKTKLPSEVKNPKLYAVLHNWRYEESKELEKPAYTILQTNANHRHGKHDAPNQRRASEYSLFGERFELWFRIAANH